MRRTIYLRVPMFMELLQLERPYSMSRYPYRLPTFCFIYRILQYRISLLCSQATHSPPTLVPSFEQGSRSSSKKVSPRSLLMLLRLEDEDPTSSMVVSKIEATQKPRSGKSKLSRRLGGADGAAIGARNPKSARGVLLQLCIAASDSSFGVARSWREYFQCLSLSLRSQ